MSPLPKASVLAGERGLRRKLSPWTLAPADFFTGSEAARTVCAADQRSCRRHRVCPGGVLRHGAGRGEYSAEGDADDRDACRAVSSNVYPWMDLAQRTGARFVTVPRPADDDWTAALLATIDPSTGVVAVPHCHWTDGGLIDLVAVGAACRRVGAVLCIDGAQSVGALPFDVKRIDPDYLVVPCYKWLLGPYSFGFLYVAPRHQGGRPIEHNWIARLNSEDFAGLVNYQPKFQAGARRFDVGERSNFALMPVAQASLKLIADWIVPRILSTLALRTNKIAQRARDDFGIDSVPADRRAGHYLGCASGAGFRPT
jgi:Selenocysteine lyase